MPVGLYVHPCSFAVKFTTRLQEGPTGVQQVKALPDDAGSGLGPVAAAASMVQGVTSVLTAEDASLDKQLPEPAAALVAAMQQRWAILLLPSTSSQVVYTP